MHSGCDNEVLSDFLLEIPNKGAINDAAKKLLQSSSEWKEGKTYYKSVKTYSHPKGPGDGAPWYCRVSEHTSNEVDFDTLWRAISVNKAETEKESA